MLAQLVNEVDVVVLVCYDLLASHVLTLASNTCLWR